MGSKGYREVGQVGLSSSSLVGVVHKLKQPILLQAEKLFDLTQWDGENIIDEKTSHGFSCVPKLSCIPVLGRFYSKTLLTSSLLTLSIETKKPKSPLVRFIAVSKKPNV